MIRHLRKLKGNLQPLTDSLWYVCLRHSSQDLILPALLDVDQHHHLLPLAPVIELDRAVCDRVVLEPLEVEVKDWWESIEEDAPLRILQPIAAHTCYPRLESLSVYNLQKTPRWFSSP